jgi:hypothetical protein
VARLENAMADTQGSVAKNKISCFDTLEIIDSSALEFQV